MTGRTHVELWAESLLSGLVDDGEVVPKRHLVAVCKALDHAIEHGKRLGRSELTAECFQAMGSRRWCSSPDALIDVCGQLRGQVRFSYPKAKK